MENTIISKHVYCRPYISIFYSQGHDSSSLSKTAGNHPSKYLRVVNLPWSSTKEEIETEFNKYGSVETVKLVTDKHSGRSKGYGFVWFQSVNQAAEVGVLSRDHNGWPRGTNYMENNPKS